MMCGNRDAVIKYMAKKTGVCSVARKLPMVKQLRLDQMDAAELFFFASLA